MFKITCLHLLAKLILTPTQSSKEQYIHHVNGESYFATFINLLHLLLNLLQTTHTIIFLGISIYKVTLKKFVS